MSIVERIKQKCREKGTSMNALEKQLGFGNGNIRRWETQKPSYDKVLAIANSLEVSLDWLITGKEPGNLTPEEQKLVDLYRNSNPTGQMAILNNAESMSRTFPKELESSASQIG